MKPDNKYTLVNALHVTLMCHIFKTQLSTTSCM